MKNLIKRYFYQLLKKRKEEIEEKLRNEEIEEKLRKEKLEEKLRKEELEAQQKREEREYELKKLEIKSCDELTQPPHPNESGEHNFDLIKLIPKFKLREDDIIIHLSLFERQAERSKIDPKD